MLKKSIIGMVMLALLAIPAIADEPWGWKKMYDTRTICSINTRTGIMKYPAVRHHENLKPEQGWEKVDNCQGYRTIMLFNNFKCLEFGAEIQTMKPGMVDLRKESENG